MCQPFKIIEIVFILQGFKGLIHHLGLFLNVAIAILIIFKSDNNNRLIVIFPDFTLKGDTPIIPNLNLEEAMLGTTTVLIKLTD